MPEYCFPVQRSNYSRSDLFRASSIGEVLCNYKPGETLPVFVAGLFGTEGDWRWAIDRVEKVIGKVKESRAHVSYALPGLEGKPSEFELERMVSTFIGKLKELPKRLNVKSLPIEFVGHSLGANFILCVLEKADELKKEGIEVKGANLVAPAFRANKLELKMPEKIYLEGGMEGCKSVANSFLLKGKLFNHRGIVDQDKDKQASQYINYLPIDKFCDVMSIAEQSAKVASRLKHASNIPIKVFAYEKDEIAAIPSTSLLKMPPVVIKKGNHLSHLSDQPPIEIVEMIKKVMGYSDKQ